MHPEIPIQEPFKKSWSEPQVIVTCEDIINYENSQKQKCALQREATNTAESQNTEDTDDCRTTTEILQNRLLELRNSLLQSQIVKQQLQTPKKQCDKTHDSCLVLGSDVSNANPNVFDRIIQQHSMSRSLPSSPLIGEIPNMTSSPTIPTTPERHFNFIPERLRFLEETRQISSLSDEIDNGFRLSQGYCSPQQGKKDVYTYS